MVFLMCGVGAGLVSMLPNTFPALLVPPRAGCGLSRREAILHAYDRCATAMLQTTIICCLGMLGFAFSSFGPTAGFATLMVTLLVTALAGGLLFLPAVLAGRSEECSNGALNCRL